MLIISYIFIRGVTVHKIHYFQSGVTGRCVFDTGGGTIGYVTMLEIFMF